MKSQYNYFAAKEIIEQEYEKELDHAVRTFRNLGYHEKQVKEEITRIINNLIKMKFREVNGELEQIYVK